MTTISTGPVVRRVLPCDAEDAAKPLGVDDIAALYAYPPPGRFGVTRAGGTGRPWLRANMVTSVDGASTVRGRTRGLSGAADRQVFAVLRGLADVILVGARTTRVERYRPVREDEVPAALRIGRSATPPIAVVTGRLDLDLDGPLLTAAPPDARTIVITTERAPRPRRAAAARHADVVVAGEDSVDLAAALDALADRGHQRVLTEGGPHLLGQLVTAGLLDELCLTVSPLLAGPDPGRIVAGVDGAPAPATQPNRGGLAATVGVPLRLAHVLEADGVLLCRYVRAADAQ